MLYHFVHIYTNELTSRVVAESGKPTDRFHLGKILLQSLKDAPNFVLQIDGGTGESQTCGSVLERSVACATCFSTLGLGVGDVIAIMAPNHLDVCIPLYAGLYQGVVVAAVSTELVNQTYEHCFNVIRPKILFCQADKLEEMQIMFKKLKLDTMIVTFDESELSFKNFFKKYKTDVSVEDFKPADFDCEKSTSFLIPTSGSTGLPKFAAISHVNFLTHLSFFMGIYTKFPEPTKMIMVVFPLQGITAFILFFCSPIYRVTTLQSSKPMIPEHVNSLINKYKPTFAPFSSTLMRSILLHPTSAGCDYSCFECITLGAVAVTQDLAAEIKKVTPYTGLAVGYGLTEAGIGFGSMLFPGQRVSYENAGFFRVRLVDVDTGKDIREPNVPGELLLQGPSIFKGYYNNPEATKEAFTEDGWFKTGDLFFRDGLRYFFVERLKFLLKYKSHHFSPMELEEVIRKHPGVLDVAVAGLADEDTGDIPVACVIRKDGHDVTAQEIKDLVKESLSDAKHLRGGVIFVDSFPLTPSTKIDMKKLKELILNSERE